MKDRLITIALSVVTTFTLLKLDQPSSLKDLDVDRLIVRKELIVSDIGAPWERGFEAQQIPRGLYARSVGEGTGGGLRFQTFRPGHTEPLTDALIGQGKMSLGGGGYGGGGLPYPSEVLQLWGGELRQADIPHPGSPGRTQGRRFRRTPTRRASHRCWPLTATRSVSGWRGRRRKPTTGSTTCSAKPSARR